MDKNYFSANKNKEWNVFSSILQGRINPNSLNETTKKHSTINQHIRLNKKESSKKYETLFSA